ncbi:Long chain acyl-CoA synthetase 6, peroxisomal [Camellia lanceoleosa]|uniref:Long chain acyl-CoA synthetase 6, peroxisomal n=1 Tax=Camellia lanceoleosa TaxID=1840588 RepID=A0ACC0INE8_9ERIC|nr:Long chain acyl-CoA synthetase 6, peroxisomal [Camellia lanceoleosa]
MDSAAQRRLKAIQAHLLPDTDDSLFQIQRNETASEFSLVLLVEPASQEDDKRSVHDKWVVFARGVFSMGREIDKYRGRQGNVSLMRVSTIGDGSILIMLVFGYQILYVVPVANEDMPSRLRSGRPGLICKFALRKLIVFFLKVNVGKSTLIAVGQTYSVVLPEKLQTGKWNVYRSAHSPLKLVDRYPNHPEIGTLHDNFVHAVETFQDYKYLGTRIRIDGTVGEYKWMTYGEVGTARLAVGSGLWSHGLSKGARIGLYFINKPEWLIVDHACSAYSYISVPLYDTLGPDAVKYIVNHADIQAIFCVPETLTSLLSFSSEMSSVA